MANLHEKKRLVFLGDSLTEWYTWDRRFPSYDVLNLGISGETVDEMLERRMFIRSRAGNPDAIFLMTGINNILQEHFAIIEPYREVVRNMATWWKHAIIVVQSLLPVEYSWISNDTIRDLNRHLQETAREFSVDYLDVYASFVDAAGSVRPGLLSDDGVHLAAKGYDVWSARVAAFLEQRFRDATGASGSGKPSP